MIISKVSSLLNFYVYVSLDVFKTANAACYYKIVTNSFLLTLTAGRGGKSKLASRPSLRVHPIQKKRRKMSISLRFLILTTGSLRRRSRRNATFREVRPDCPAFLPRLSTSGPDHTCNIRYLRELRDPSGIDRK